MEEELISVIVPIFKVEKYLKKCIDSILNQTYKNMEIILVDDGSPDNCPYICDNYAKKDSRIKVIHKINGGISDTRNEGLKRATGKWVTFIDSDDYIDKNMIDTLYKLAIENEADISIIDFIKIDETSNIIQNKDCKNKTRIFNSKTAIIELFNDNSFGNYMWNKLYKKELFEDIKFPIGKTMEDLAVMYQLFYKSKNIVYNNKQMYFYVQRKNSILHRREKSLINNRFELSLEKYNFLKSKYPDMIENYKAMLEVCLETFQYLNTQEKKSLCINIYKEIPYKMKIFNMISIKSKIRYILFILNKKLYIKLFIIKDKLKS